MKNIETTRMHCALHSLLRSSQTKRKTPTYLGCDDEFGFNSAIFDKGIRRRPTCPPSCNATKIRVSSPSTFIKISPSQGGKSTDSSGIAKSWATCASGTHSPAARSSSVTNAEWLFTDLIIMNPRSDSIARGEEYCRRYGCEIIPDRRFGFELHFKACTPPM